MKSYLQAFFIIISGLLTYTSCGDIPTCVDRETSIVKIDFVGEDGVTKAITINSLSAIGDNDGFPDYADTTLSTLQLPLNPGARTATFILEHPDGLDTIGLKYDVVAQLISPECGLDAAFSKLDTTRITFIQAVILSNIVNEQIPSNIEITH